MMLIDELKRTMAEFEAEHPRARAMAFAMSEVTKEDLRRYFENQGVKDAKEDIGLVERFAGIPIYIDDDLERGQVDYGPETLIRSKLAAKKQISPKLRP